jgi:hypothetical protein
LSVLRHAQRMKFRVIGAALVSVICTGALSLVVDHRDATASVPPRVVAVVKDGASHRVALLDARTLHPVRGAWSRNLGRYFSVASSPSGSRVAVDAIGTRSPVVVLDSATGRLMRRYRQGGNTGDLYWLGGENPHAADMLLVEVNFGCYSSGCEYGILTLGVERDDGFNADVGGIAAALRGGLVFEGGGLSVFGRKGFQVDITLRRMPKDAPQRVVADVARDRLFVVSSAGVIAEIRDAVRHPVVTYHPVALNGRPFNAAWVGRGRIALWGADGLGTIDTRTWSTRSIEAGVIGAVATRLGIAAWKDDAGGLLTYQPNGRAMLHVLDGKQVTSALAVGDYLYAETKGDGRYSVNLRTGAIVGPLPPEVWIAVPTLSAIP